MAITYHIAGNVLRVSGLDDTLTPATWKRRLADAAEEAEKMIAEDFAEQKAAGRKLRANTAAYDDWKAANGYDSRRGHREGLLQDALDDGDNYTVSYNARAGRGTITLREQALNNAVPHAAYYAEAKVNGGKILVFTRKVAEAAVAVLREALTSAKASRAVRERRRQVQREDGRLRFQQQRQSGVARIRVRVG